MKRDSTIERVRKVRHQISAEHNHDPRQLIAYYLEMEREYEERILREEQPEAKTYEDMLAP